MINQNGHPRPSMPTPDAKQSRGSGYAHLSGPFMAHVWPLLRDDERTAFVTLMTYAPNIHPSAGAVARRLQKCIRSIRRSIKSMVAAGVIVRHASEGGSSRATSSYTIPDYESEDVLARISQTLSGRPTSVMSDPGDASDTGDANITSPVSPVSITGVMGDTRTITSNKTKNTPTEIRAVSFRKEEEKIIVPDSLKTQACLAAFRNWAKYKHEAGTPLTLLQKRLVIKQCEALGPTRTVAAINHSIASNYKAIVDPSGNAQGRYKRPDPLPATIPAGRQDN